MKFDTPPKFPMIDTFRLRIAFGILSLLIVASLTPCLQAAEKVAKNTSSAEAKTSERNEVGDPTEWNWDSPHWPLDPQAFAPVENPQTPQERGYAFLRKKDYLPPDFSEKVLSSLWKRWSEPERSQAEAATEAERRKMIFSRYGLIHDPSQPEQPLGYLSDGKGNWVMSCLACHSGKVAGKPVLGAPNSHYALQTLTEDVTASKVFLRESFSHMDYGALRLPLAQSDGATNAVIFGVAFGRFRDKDLNVVTPTENYPLLHHDVDPPPLWHLQKKSHLYFDGYLPKQHRPLLQFVMLPQNNAETLKGWEEDFRDIQAWIESLQPPPYPGKIDQPLADKGKLLFEQTCADCHGTYGEKETYPNLIVPIEEVGTDRLRLDSLTAEHRSRYEASWIGHYGKYPVRPSPGGYVAPPLDGIWATAPYLHNGSVPTLWHLMNPEERPQLWRRSENGYDREKIGITLESFQAYPDAAKTAKEKRRYFNTRIPGKSAAGHDFPEVLTTEEKWAVIEYLKTL
ncbi:Cytochrome c [Planctomycetales bacterium 10988]|nr:Cytochrome c [Planctomycetales bacterium 10988]